MSMSKDDPLTEEDFDLVRAAGASAAFMRFLKADGDPLGVGRHSVREHLRKFTGGRADGEVTPEGLSASVPSAGGYFQCLWHGDLMEALCKADGNNSVLMTHTFDPEEVLVAARDNESWSIGYAKRIVEERYDEYGPAGVETPTPPER